MMKKTASIFKTLFTALAVCSFMVLSQAQIYVDIDATGAGDGSSWTDAYTDLQPAIDATTSGEIWVADGTYKPDVSNPGDRDLSFSMKNGVAIYGGFDGTETMLTDRDPIANVTTLSGDIDASGNNDSYHVVDNSTNNLDASAVLDGFTISGGNNAVNLFGSPNGAGMYNVNSSPTITNCTFAGNRSGNGFGGGMYNSNMSSPTITNCTFQNNLADEGGGIYNDNSSPTITDCSFFNNNAFDKGAGMYNSNMSSPTITNSTFVSNNAVITILSAIGGGMFNDNSDPTITNCTFANNSATNGGGGIYNQNNSNPTLTNCILWGNGTSLNDMTSATISYSIVEGTTVHPGTGNSNSDPIFINANDPDGPDDMLGTPDDVIAIAVDSPGAGAGDPAISAPVTDIAGTPRGSSPFDIGAYVAIPRPPIFVDLDAFTGANTGATWADAYTDLQVAIAAARPGDSIWVAEGTYKPDLSNPGDRGLSFSMKNGVAIYGGFDGTETMLTDRNPVTNVTILSGDIGVINNSDDNAYHVVDNSTNNLDATAVLDGFGIVRGNANSSSPQNVGGGMYNVNSSPTITNCTFTSNLATQGGGMYNTNTSPIIINCTFDSNSATQGGGMYNFDGSSPTITNCTFTYNSADFGGGMYNDNSSPAITNCTFDFNYASVGGGGMYNDNSSPTITNCTFDFNNARFGVGMFNVNSSPTITNCSFSENNDPILGYDPGDGVGMYNVNSSPTITNCTFVDNSADSGGGMYNFVSSPTITNCTFDFNNASVVGGGMYNDNSSPTITNCTFVDNRTSDLGGGIYNDNSSPTITNCTFFQNRANNDGGGMLNDASSPTITNCTFANNFATNGGGGMYNTNSSNPTLTNCILWGNGTSFNNTNATVTYSIVEGTTVYPGTGNLNRDPQFINPNDEFGPDNILGTADDGIAIADTSPGAAAGNPAISTPATDIAGTPRGSAPFDMGAYVAVVTPVYQVGTQSFINFQAALDSLMGQAGTIVLLRDFTDSAVTSIPSNITLEIPQGFTLTFTNIITNTGSIVNRGTLILNNE